MAWYDLFTATTKTAENATKVIDTITTGIVSGIDKIWYTEEEKEDTLNKRIEYRQKASETILEFVKAFANENSEQSKARREIAMMVIKSYFAMIFLAIATAGIAPTISTLIFKIISEIFWLVSMVAGTYFIPHQLSKIVDFKPQKPE